MRDPADRILVVCGSERTESDYLNGFKRHFKKRTVSLKILEKPGSTVEVVRDAIGVMDRAEGDYDQVWCVVDVDEYQDFDVATPLAHRNGVRLAVSNPCFELWLLLHHDDHTAPIADYRRLKVLLARHVRPSPGKGVNFDRDYADEALWRGAVERARKLARFGDEHTTNPSTGVWRLALALHGLEVDNNAGSL
ncbi:RloB family protein [Streptomyces sp. V17-9]|uniref:RloB family protein n=1 Tax=Streptomyces sp. V17-9 TaxID=2831149 RepID=UPI001BB0515E|nr:RloB family protein [Streptomyces sp. V17-9]